MANGSVSVAGVDDRSSGVHPRERPPGTARTPVDREIQVLRIAVQLLNRHRRADAALECVRVIDEIRRARGIK